MEISDVKRWLSGKRDYTEGVALFLKFGTNDFLKDLLEEGEDDYNREKLEEELGKIGEQVVDQKPVEITKKVQSSPIATVEPDFYLLPAQVQEWKKEANRKFRENAHRQKCLEDVKDKFERGELAHHILMVDDELQALYSKIDYYELHKVMPPEDEPLPDDVKDLTALEIKNEIQRISVQISKQKNNQERTREVEHWKKRKEILTRALNGLI